MKRFIVSGDSQWYYISDETGRIAARFGTSTEAQEEADVRNVAFALQAAWHPSLCHCIGEPEEPCDPPPVEQFRDAARAALAVVGHPQGQT